MTVGRKSGHDWYTGNKDTHVGGVPIMTIFPYIYKAVKNHSYILLVTVQ